MPRLSFIIPLFNHLAESQVALHSLLETVPSSCDFEVILIDDYSTDGTRAWLSKLFDSRIKVLFNQQNLGFAKTNNIGASASSGEYLCLINNDLVFYRGWLEPMLDGMKNTLNAGVMGNLQYRVTDNILDHGGVFINPLGQFDHDRIEPCDDLVSPIKVLAVTGACLLIRREDYLAVGGFDETYVNGCEDIDLCLKMKEFGKAVYVTPRSRIKHHVSLSRSRTSLQNQRNSQYLYKKWRKLIKFHLSRVWSDLLAEGEEEWGRFVCGQLLPNFLAMPQVAARTIAEVMLQREEARWARDLNAASINLDWIKRIRISGLRYIPEARASLPQAKVELVVDGLSSARNFYVCGFRTDEYLDKRIAITLTANNIQEQTFILSEDRNINAGLIDPILIPGIENRFTVSFQFLDEKAQKLGPANNAMLITHFVVDDHRINLN